MEKNIINYYNHYDEDGRLFRNYSHQVEWLTTLYYFNRVLPLTAGYLMAAREPGITPSNWPSGEMLSNINFMAALHLNLNVKLENMEDVLKFYSTRGEDDPFTYLLPEEIEKTAHDHQLKILHHLTSDGTAYMRGEQLNNLTKESFDQYMKLHLETCEYKYILGFGLHGLIILTA